MYHNLDIIRASTKLISSVQSSNNIGTYYSTNSDTDNIQSVLSAMCVRFFNQQYWSHILTCDILTPGIITHKKVEDRNSPREETPVTEPITFHDNMYDMISW